MVKNEIAEKKELEVIKQRMDALRQLIKRYDSELKQLEERCIQLTEGDVS